MVLADPMPSNELIAAHNPDGTVTFQPKKTRRTIDNFDTWLSAWSVFEQLIAIKSQKKTQKYIINYHSIVSSFAGEIENSNGALFQHMTGVWGPTFGNKIVLIWHSRHYVIQNRKLHRNLQRTNITRSLRQKTNTWTVIWEPPTPNCTRLMCAKAVGESSLIPDVTRVIKRPTTILNLDYLGRNLLTHTDIEFVDTIIHNAQNGMPLGYTGHDITENITTGRQLTHFAISSKQLFQETFVKVVNSEHLNSLRHQTLWDRIIYDLSWPPCDSINDYININGSVPYDTIDTIGLVKKFGNGANVKIRSRRCI